MAYTREQRLANLQKARESRATTAVAEPPDEETDETQLLAQLGQALIGASKKKQAGAQALKQLEGILGQLDPQEHPELLANPVIQEFVEKLGEQRAQSAEHQDDPPGTVYGEGLAVTAKPWTWQWVEKLHDIEPDGMFRKKTIIPTKTQQVIVNGLGVWFADGLEVTFYAPWVDQYLASNKTAQELTRHTQWLMKVGPWAPSIPPELQPRPDPDWLADANGVSTRAAGAGMYMPGSGWNPAVDGRNVTPGEAAVTPAPPEGAAA